MPEPIVCGQVWPILRPFLFFIFVPIPSLLFPLIFDGPIGVGYSESKLAGGMAMMVVSLLLVGLADRRPIGSFGLRLDRLAVRDFVIGIAIPTIQFGISFGIELAMGWVRVQSFA
jgi:hypothetical protein